MENKKTSEQTTLKAESFNDRQLSEPLATDFAPRSDKVVGSTETKTFQSCGKENTVVIEETTIEMTRKQLYDEIWENSVAGVAQKYGITYSWLIKQVKEAGIPIPSSSYWTKLTFDKPVEKTGLPGNEDTVVTISSKPPIKSKRNPSGKTVPEMITGKATPVQVDKTAAILSPKSIPLPELGEPKTIARNGRTYNIYDRESLYQEVWAFPITEAAKKYKVSDVAIHKVCKSLNIPTPPPGYWAKVRAGKTVPERPSLPENNKIEQKLGTQTGPTNSHISDEVFSLNLLSEEDQAIVMAVARQIQLTGETDKMHPEIIAHRQAILSWDKGDKAVNKDWRGNRSDGKQPPFLWESISLKSLPRICRIFDTLIQAMEPLGCTITDDMKFVVCGETVSVSVTETQSKISHVLTANEQHAMLVYQDAQKHGKYASKPNIRKYDYFYNGTLNLRVANKRSFSDNKTYSLEDRLGDILISMYEAAERIRVERLAAEEAERKRKEEQAKREERRERYNAEVQRTNALMNASEDYAAACKIRAYVAAVEDRKDISEDEHSWIGWAKQKADWLDPTISRKDEYFGVRKHNEDADRKELKESYSLYGW